MDPSCSLHSLIDQETVVEEEEDDDVIDYDELVW